MKVVERRAWGAGNLCCAPALVPDRSGPENRTSYEGFLKRRAGLVASFFAVAESDQISRAYSLIQALIEAGQSFFVTDLPSTARYQQELVFWIDFCQKTLTNCSDILGLKIVFCGSEFCYSQVESGQVGLAAIYYQLAEVIKLYQQQEWLSRILSIVQTAPPYEA